jgi:hypothetical protein
MQAIRRLIRQDDARLNINMNRQVVQHKSVNKLQHKFDLAQSTDFEEL